MRHRNLHSDSVLVHTGYIGTGTGFRYPTLIQVTHFSPRKITHTKQDIDTDQVIVFL